MTISNSVRRLSKGTRSVAKMGANTVRRSFKKASKTSRRALRSVAKRVGILGKRSSKKRSSKKRSSKKRSSKKRSSKKRSSKKRPSKKRSSRKRSSKKRSSKKRSSKKRSSKKRSSRKRSSKKRSSKKRSSKKRSSRKHKRGGAVRMPSKYFGGSSGRYSSNPSNHKGVSQGSIAGCMAGPNIGPFPSLNMSGGSCGCGLKI